MRIVFLDHATDLGGAEVSLLGLLGTLDRSRFEPTLACPPGALADRARRLGATVAELHLEKLRQGWNPLAALTRLCRGRRALQTLLREGRFDIVHANTLRAAAYASGVAGGRHAARFVWHVRDAAMPVWTRRRLLKRCSIAIAPSQFIAGQLGESRRVRVIPNGVDPSDVPAPEAGRVFRSGVGLPQDAPVVGCLGRLLPWKGQHYFVEMAARLAQRVPSARFLIVGAPLYAEPGSDYPVQLRAQAVRLAVEDKLLFVGHRDDPLAALSAMNVVVNCSRDEPFGRVLVEAMACGRPVVAFRSGAVPEIVADAQTGLLVPFGDTEALAQAVFGLLREPARAAAYGAAARRRVAERFRLDASTRSIEAVYGELAPSRPSG